MPTFQYVSPSEEQITLMQHYRDLYQSLFSELEKLAPSRGLSLAKTHLEESAMWLNKAITLND